MMMMMMMMKVMLKMTLRVKDDKTNVKDDVENR